MASTQLAPGELPDNVRSAAAADPDTLVSESKAHGTTFFSPLFYIAVAFRLHAPADAAHLTPQVRKIRIINLSISRVFVDLTRLYYMCL